MCVHSRVFLLTQSHQEGKKFYKSFLPRERKSEKAPESEKHVRSLMIVGDGEFFLHFPRCLWFTHQSTISASWA